MTRDTGSPRPAPRGRGIAVDQCPGHLTWSWEHGGFHVTLSRAVTHPHTWHCTGHYISPSITSECDIWCHVTRDTWCIRSSGDQPRCAAITLAPGHWQCYRRWLMKGNCHLIIPHHPTHCHRGEWTQSHMHLTSIECINTHSTLTHIVGQCTEVISHVDEKITAIFCK